MVSHGVQERKILMVDDEEDVLELYQQTLEEVFDSKQFKITQASDGEAALQHIQNEKFDIIILDLHMPKLNGEGVIRKTAESSLNQKTPICLITGNMTISDERLQEEAFKKVTVMQKPFKQTSFMRKLKIALKIPTKKAI